MRKLRAAGVGVLSVLALTLAPASPAAALVAPDSVAEQVCDALPAGIGGVNDLEAVNDGVRRLLSTDIGTNNLDLGARSTLLVDAVVMHIRTIDGGGDVATSAAVVSGAASAYADSAARWTADVKAVLEATLRALVIDMQQGVLGNIDSGLDCPAVVPED